MSELFEQRNGRYRPRLLCDVCKGLIRDACGALVVYGDAGTGAEPTLTELLYCHKACQGQARARVGHTSVGGMSDSLRSHLVMLAATVGITPEDFREAYESLVGQGAILPPDPAG